MPAPRRGTPVTTPASSGIQIVKGVFKIANGSSAVEVPVKFSKKRALGIVQVVTAEWKTGAMRLPSNPCAFLVTIRYKDGTTGTAILAPSDVMFPVSMAVLAEPKTPSLSIRVQAILSSEALKGLQVGAALGFKK
jgi:hypothetical protein